MSSYELEYSAPEDDIVTGQTDLDILGHRVAPRPSSGTPEDQTPDHRPVQELGLLRAENYDLQRLAQILKQPVLQKNGELETFLRDLCRAGELDRRRSWILEMVSSHAPLPQTLSEIATLAKTCYGVTGVALWAATENVLSLQASAGLPDGLEGVVSSLSLDMDGGTSAECDWFEDRVREVAALRGDQAEFVPLRDGEGRVVGLLVAFWPEGKGEGTPAGVLMQLAHLGSLAIESDRLHERLAFHAQHDALTGLPNRLLFQDRVKQAVGVAERDNEKVAVLWLDLDHYKQINDTFGHTAGDELLCEVARRLRNCVHHTDTVARFGGDEFTMVISNVADEGVVERISARILKAICRPVALNGHEVRISASIGMSMYPDHGLNTDLLMRNADLGMYHAKRSGRNQYQMFLPEFGDSLDRRLEIEEHLRNALHRGEFHLEYQPLIGLHGDIAGIEALLRWNNPKLGRIAPVEFIPLAEEMGLIVGIGEWVARAACRDGAQWIRSGGEFARLAINVSALQLVDRDFTTMIGRALDDFGFPPARLEVEVTETVLIGNLERAVDGIARLRTMGIHFSIDDFGTGYSSLNQLRTLPVDHLKIDRSFIRDIDRLEGNSLVRGIIALAHSLRLKVVAEGVETEAQLAALLSMGCDRNQGFHLHRPMDADAVMRLLGCDPL
jgi:diguanylate cyclase (GGDEF)-like protein